MSIFKSLAIACLAELGFLGLAALWSHGVFHARTSEPAVFLGNTEHVQIVGLSPDGRRLASVSKDGTTKLWDVATCRECASLPTGRVKSVAISPDGTALAIPANQREIKLWDVARGKERGSLAVHAEVVPTLVFSPDGKTLASNSYKERSIKLWDLATGKERATLCGHLDTIHSFAFSPDGTTLVSGSYDKTLRVWDVASGSERMRLREDSWVWFGTPHDKCFAFTPDGKTLAACADDAIRVWDLETGAVRRTLRDPSWDIEFVVDSVICSPSGQYLASVVGETIDLWHLATGCKMASYVPFPTKEVYTYPASTFFSPAGKLVAIAIGHHGNDALVQRWEAGPLPGAAR
jgi:WD40 repeat protein